MRKVLLLIFLAFSVNVSGQFVNTLYEDFLKYGTIYAAGNASNAYESSRKDYFLARAGEGGLYEVPRVEDVTEYHPFDYRIGFGIRKLARFDYEVKGSKFYTGTENNVALSAPTAAVHGLEYLFHYEKERLRSEEFVNFRYFLRHTGKYHIVKLESREQGDADFEYKSAEARLRLPIGKKFSISAGAIFKTHKTAHGYNPIEIWLNEMDDAGNFINPWYTLGHVYGLSDHHYESTYDNLETGQEETITDWYWIDEEGDIIAHTDLEFRNTVYRDLIHRFNNERWDMLEGFGEIAPIVGFDFYHYQNDFWLHTYGNYIIPYHSYVMGDKMYNYLNRNNWGRGGLRKDAEPEQWSDYQAGIMMGWKVSRHLGVFIEVEYTKFWSSEMFQSTLGINYTFK